MKHCLSLLIILLASLTCQGLPLDSLVSYPHWNSLSLPARLELTSPARSKFSGQITMCRGQWVTVSVRILGMEMAVLSVSQDSVWAVDKFHKVYVSESTAKVLGGFPATITDIQRLLMGQLFAIGNPQQDVTVEEFEQVRWGIPQLPPRGVEYGFQLAPDELLPDALAVSVSGFQPVSVVYDDFYDTPCGPVAAYLGFSAMLGRAPLQASLEMNYEKAKYNKQFSSPGLPNLKGYKKRDLKAFLQSIGIK